MELVSKHFLSQACLSPACSPLPGARPPGRPTSQPLGAPESAARQRPPGGRGDTICDNKQGGVSHPRLPCSAPAPYCTSRSDRGHEPQTRRGDDGARHRGRHAVRTREGALGTAHAAPALPEVRCLTLQVPARRGWRSVVNRAASAVAGLSGLAAVGSW